MIASLRSSLEFAICKRRNPAPQKIPGYVIDDVCVGVFGHQYFTLRAVTILYVREENEFVEGTIRSTNMPCKHYTQLVSDHLQIDNWLDLSSSALYRLLNRHTGHLSHRIRRMVCSNADMTSTLNVQRPLTIFILTLLACTTITEAFAKVNRPTSLLTRSEGQFDITINHPLLFINRKASYSFIRYSPYFSKIS